MIVLLHVENMLLKKEKLTVFSMRLKLDPE